MGCDRKAAIMRRNSVTFFYSSLFFPASIRQDVLTLYAFVRTADDFVDSIPQDPRGLDRFRNDYSKARQTGHCEDPIVSEFVALANRLDFRPEWVESFLDAMAQDLRKAVYETLDETLEYMYGSAETVGMMMARILRLPDESLACARALGRAFQYVNFIRDVAEDAAMGRQYLPGDELFNAGFTELTARTVLSKPDAFEAFIRQQLTRYHDWVREASEGFRFIPPRALAAIRTATDMYNYSADVIARRPVVVFERKVKPGKAQVLAAGMRNLMGALIR